MKKKVSLLCVLSLIVQMLIPFGMITASAEPEGVYAEKESPSAVYNMNIDWRYTKAAGTVYPLKPALESVKDANGKNFYETDYVEDEAWTDVSLPHAVNAEDSFDGLGVDAGEGGLYRGFMFYRKKITVPETDAGKKFILEFEAFRQSVYVYVNGNLAGYYEAGVAPVGFDLTDYIVAGGENLIAVATDNSASRGNENDTKETIPGSVIPDNANNGYGYQWNTKDFNEVQGGLTGNVKLHAKNKIYQTLPLYNNLKTTGNYIHADNFDFNANSADITVEAEVRNETAEAKDVTLHVDIVDNDGNVVSSFDSLPETVSAAADADEDRFLTVVPDNAYVDGVGQENNNVDTSTVQVTKITAAKNVSGLKFWSDVSPNLYTVYTYLMDGQTVIDSQKCTTGFREVTYDKDKGLQINGVTTYLKGYAQRSTNEWAAIGVANDWLTDIDMQLIKKSNANFIRWMHIAPNPVDIRGGDKYGVISIVPAGDKESEAAGRAWDQRVEAMRDVIIYFRNSPSAIFYEAGNDYINETHMQEMVDLKKKLDPKGGRFMGSRAGTGKALSLSNAEWVGTIIHRQDDVMYADMGANGNYVPMIETEYHRNEAPRRVWDDFSPPYYDYVNKFIIQGGKKDGYDVWDQTQEDFSRSAFGSSDDYSYFYNNRVGGSGKNYYSGAALMVWSDSNMHVRNCGVENARTSGRVDAVRIPKESFYAMQAAQSATPKIHILGHWNYPSYTKGDKENGNYWYYKPVAVGDHMEVTAEMDQRDPTDKTVYVIGSADIAKVELYINDTLIDTDTTAENNFIYAFPHIDVTQSGKVSAKAYSEQDKLVAEHEIKTAGEAATIKLTPVTGPEGLLADGSDLAYVDVAVVDAEGNVCPLDERKITFTLSDENSDTKIAKFIGGYNSGFYGNHDGGAYNEPGGRIVNHKNYVFAECGINRVFVQSTRNSGSVTLTATAEGMQPVSIELSTKPVEVSGGLMTDGQQSFAQGAVPTPVPTPAPAVLKALGETFTADWTEGTGNVVKVNPDEKDYYTVSVNGTPVTFTDRAYKPDTSTGVVAELNPILDALRAAGADVSYTWTAEGERPAYVTEGEAPFVTVTSGGNTIVVLNGATEVYINEEKNLTNYGTALNSSKTALMCELATVIGNINGVNVKTNEETKEFAITAEAAAPAQLLSGDGAVLFGEEGAYAAALSYVNGGTLTVSASSKLENAKLIIAGYDKNGALKKVKLENTTLEAGASATKTIDGFDGLTTKAMLWDDNMAPLALTADCMDHYKIDEVYEYDEVKSNIDCNAAIENMELSSDTSPDKTAYLSNTSFGGTDKYQSNGVCLQSDGIGANSKADIMWEADIRFNEDGAGITPFDDGDKKLGTCIRRHDNGEAKKLTIQTGSKDFKEYYEIDPTKWYHIALVGRYSAADAATDMYVYEYNGSEKTLLGVNKNVNQRNMSANNSNGASHWNVHRGTSVDNLRITLLGADTLKVTSDGGEIKAGNTMQFNYSATRQGEYITNPAVTWEIYNADNTALADDAAVTITDGGILNVGLDAKAQTVNVRATAASGIFASKPVEIKAVDISNVKFDTLTLTAEKDYVSATEPLKITAAAVKGGNAVELADSDLIWYAADETDMQRLGDAPKWIKITNGTVTVDPKAVSQDITIRAADLEDKVRGSIKIHIKSSDAIEGEEDGALDRLLTADNCEAPKDSTTFVTGPDGTHAYKATAGFQTGYIAETGADVVVEMDIRFDGEGAGFQPAKSGKVNTCVICHNGNLSIQTGSSAFTTLTPVSADKWYHITLIRKKGSYAHMIFEEYDENGERVNPQTFKDLNQRNDENTAFVNINANTSYDNLRLLSPVPDSITVDTDVKTVFAGGTVKAASAMYWKGLEMKNPDASTFEYKIYDSEDKYPIEGDKVTVGQDGTISVDAMANTQDYYVRAISKASGKSASAKFTVASSDIITINKLEVDENKERNLVRLDVTKNFFYSEVVTFVTEVFGADGAVKNVYTKNMYGNALKLGENKVGLGIELPESFDKTADTVKVYAVTRLSSDAPAEPDELMAIVRGEGGKVSVSLDKTQSPAAPVYDADSNVIVLVLKEGADETNVQDGDILYYDCIGNPGAIFDVTLPSDYTGAITVKTAGKVNGVHTVRGITAE